MSRPAPSPDHRALFAAGWPAVFCSSGALFAGTVGAKRGPFGTGLAVLAPLRRRRRSSGRPALDRSLLLQCRTAM